MLYFPSILFLTLLKTSSLECLTLHLSAYSSASSRLFSTESVRDEYCSILITTIAPVISEFDYFPSFFFNAASALSSLYLIGMTILPLKSIYPYFLPSLDTFSTLSNLPSSLPIDVPKYCFIS